MEEVYFYSWRSDFLIFFGGVTKGVTKVELSQPKIIQISPSYSNLIPVSVWSIRTQKWWEIAWWWGYDLKSLAGLQPILLIFTFKNWTFGKNAPLPIIFLLFANHFLLFAKSLFLKSAYFCYEPSVSDTSKKQGFDFHIFTWAAWFQPVIVDPQLHLRLKIRRWSLHPRLILILSVKSSCWSG